MAGKLAIPLLLGALLGFGAAFHHATRADAGGLQCAPSGWSMPGGGMLEAEALFDDLSARAVVLLGERHDAAAHHQWQLDTLRALHARRGDLVLGLEMFPRRVQPALDAWVRGELSEADFLARSDWAKVWRYDAGLYADIFRYARDHRIPMRALNVEAAFTRAVGRNGFDSTAEDSREGVTRPAAPSPAYAEWLEQIYRLHLPPERRADADAVRRGASHFIDAQLVWDRAMAQGIADVLRERPDTLVVGLMGNGHLNHGHGVPHQLRDLGVHDQATLLPWDGASDCSQLVAGLADAIFTLERRPGGSGAPI
ncbi:MAG: ChaN family lipoprotein [Rhodocyclaceae bacterium]